MEKSDGFPLGRPLRLRLVDSPRSRPGVLGVVERGSAAPQAQVFRQSRGHSVENQLVPLPVGCFGGSWSRAVTGVVDAPEDTSPRLRLIWHVYYARKASKRDLTVAPRGGLRPVFSPLGARRGCRRRCRETIASRYAASSTEAMPLAGVGSNFHRRVRRAGQAEAPPR